MWQDTVIAIVGFLFGIMLFPQLRDVLKGSYLNVYTAGLTTAGIFTLAITFATLNLWISVTADIFTGTVWLIIFLLSVKNLRKEKKTTLKIASKESD